MQDNGYQEPVAKARIYKLIEFTWKNKLFSYKITNSYDNNYNNNNNYY